MSKFNYNSETLKDNWNFQKDSVSADKVTLLRGNSIHFHHFFGVRHFESCFARKCCTEIASAFYAHVSQCHQKHKISN